MCPISSGQARRIARETRDDITNLLQAVRIRELPPPHGHNHTALIISKWPGAFKPETRFGTQRGLFSFGRQGLSNHIR